MGGAVALKVHLKQPQDWDGVVLVAPMCKVSLFMLMLVFNCLLLDLIRSLHLFNHVSQSLVMKFFKNIFMLKFIDQSCFFTYRHP